MVTLNVGQTLDRGTLKMKLDGLVYPDPSAVYPANLSVKDANDLTLASGITISPGQSYTYAQPGTGNRLKMDVCQTALGATLNAKWAKAQATLLGSNNTTSACATDRIKEVDCSQDNASARATATWVGSDGCTYRCKAACPTATKPLCKAGYEVYSYYDAKGCLAYGCRSVCPSESARPTCSAGSELYSYYDSSGCIVYGCKTVCNNPAPACAKGTALYTYTDSKGCTAYGCRSVCADIAPTACGAGYESYSYTDSNGCTAYGCKLVAKIPSEEAASSADIAGSLADASGDLYAKVMAIVGVYVEAYKK
jgi:hypothetical protein